MHLLSDFNHESAGYSFISSHFMHVIGKFEHRNVISCGTSLDFLENLNSATRYLYVTNIQLFRCGEKHVEHNSTYSFSSFSYTSLPFCFFHRVVNGARSRSM